MNLKQLPYLIAIESSGTLLGASKQLGISQPALSKCLSELEEEIGMPLFYRVKKQMIPTAAGTLYLDAARQILRMSNQAYESIRALSRQSFESVRVGVSPHRGALFLAHIYPELMHFFPDCRLMPAEGYALDLKDKVLSGAVDFAITSHSGTSPEGLKVLVCNQEEIVLAVPAYYPIVRHSSQLEFADLPFADLNDFEKYSFIMPEETSALYQAIAPTISALKYKPIVSMSTANVMMEKAMIQEGVGIGLLPAYHASLNDKVAYFRLYQTMYLPACIITREGHSFTDVEKFLIYLHLRDTFHQDPLQNTIGCCQELLSIYEEEDDLYRTLSIRQAPFTPELSSGNSSTAVSGHKE